MTTKRFATRDFSDAGTGRSFKGGAELTDVDPGHLANYEAAGLAGAEPKAAEQKVTTPTKPGDKPA